MEDLTNCKNGSSEDNDVLRIYKCETVEKFFPLSFVKI